MQIEHFSMNHEGVIVIDAINGAVSVEAKKVGLLAPVNETVADLLRSKEYWAVSE